MYVNINIRAPSARRRENRELVRNEGGFILITGQQGISICPSSLLNISHLMSIHRGGKGASMARAGDLIIVQEKYDSLTPVNLQAGGFLNNRYGRFSHDELIGKPLGRRWEASSHPGAGSGTQQCAGFVHALAPTPELWSMAMLHRTQIVYPHDAAIIALYLELRPGAVVVEAGTGSGSASVAFSRVVAPSGKVYSFEFHVPRATAAESDFEALGISSVVKVSRGVDVVKDGFVGVPDGSADAIFLDLPAPYLMGDEVTRVLKPGGTVCTFSPCIEQVQRSCEMFRSGQFHSMRTITAPIRTFETREQVMQTPGFDSLVSDFHDCGIDMQPISRCPDAKKRKREIKSSERIARPLRTAGAERFAMSAENGGRHDGRVIRVQSRLHSKPFSLMKGHTSYLTFARRVWTGKGDDMPDRVCKARTYHDREGNEDGTDEACALS